MRPRARRPARAQDGALRWLAELERVRAEYGPGAAERKRAACAALERARLSRAADVLRLHDALCFLRAYPDDRSVLAGVERLLAGFEARPDLRRHRAELEDSGIAGTTIHFRFFEPMAGWIAERWPDRFTIDWDEFEHASRVEYLLPLFTAFAESPALDELSLGARGWIRRLVRAGTTDGAFLVAGFRRAFRDQAAREKIWDELDPPLALTPGPDTPARGRELLPGVPRGFQRGPIDHSRPDLSAEVRQPPRSARPLSRARGGRAVDLARSCMITRIRDLDAFSYGDPRDVRIVDCGDGLAFACIGVIPERRLLLEAVYACLTLRNGVPIGYVLFSALFGSAEIAYNVFETWRGAEAGRIYGRVIAMVAHLFAVDTFTIYPYQLGENNEEAIASGAWWFYQKLGFRPLDAGALALMRRELARMKRNPRHRSTPATLRRLAAHNVYWHASGPRDDVIGRLPLANVGFAVTDMLRDRFGIDRTAAEDACSREAAKLLGTSAPRGFKPDEALAWRRWAPLVLTLPGIEGWSPGEKSALVEVIRAKGGVRESEFVTRFDAHAKLRDAVRTLAMDRRKS